MKAGLALTAGGVATLMMMPLVGTLVRHVQPKYLIAVGLTIEAIACYHLRGFTTDVTFAHVAWARVLQAIGLPFLFVPISTVAYAGLPPGKNNNASALINTMRNLGGSFGISLAVALLSRRGQFHHSRMIETVNDFSPAAQHASAAKLRVLEQAIEYQARMGSYIDVFWMLAIVAAVAVPLMLLLLRRVEPGAGGGGH
jgi:MFS transporter, DHA2 family, multidrug resistance protein